MKLPATIANILVFITTVMDPAEALSTVEISKFNDKKFAKITPSPGGKSYQFDILKLPDKECNNPGGANNPCVHEQKTRNFPVPSPLDRNNLCKYELPNGPIGYAKNGAAIFRVFAGKSGQANFDNSGDIYSNNPFNKYEGHTNPKGVYHYHMLPDWSAIGTDYGTDNNFIGFALDGFPLYGPTLDKPGDWEPDYECNGYFHKTDPTQYRYILTDSPLVTDTTFGPSIKCFRSVYQNSPCITTTTTIAPSVATKLLASGHVATGILTLLILWKFYRYAIK